MSHRGGKKMEYIPGKIKELSFCLKASGGHQLCVVEQTGPTHPGLCLPEWPGLSVGPPQERPHH